MTNPTKWFVRPAKTKLSLDIRPVWSVSSLCALWVAKDPSFLYADNDWVDVRLIWIFDGRTGHFVGFVVQRLRCYVSILCINFIEDVRLLGYDFDPLTLGNIEKVKRTMHYSLVPNSQSGSRQWSLLTILLPDIVFLGHRGIYKFYFAECIVVFFHSVS